MAPVSRSAKISTTHKYLQPISNPPQGVVKGWRPSGDRVVIFRARKDTYNLHFRYPPHIHTVSTPDLSLSASLSARIVSREKIAITA